MANAGEFNCRYLTCQISAILYADRGDRRKSQSPHRAHPPIFADRRDRRIKSPGVSPASATTTKTATETKTSLENRTEFVLFVVLRDYFNSSICTKTEDYLGNKSIGVGAPCVHVLHKTLNLVIRRCCFEEDGKEIYQNLNRMCRAIFFSH